MKPAILFFAALALVVPTSGSSGQSRDNDITVQGVHLTPARWAAAVGRKLDAALDYPKFYFGDPVSGGIVSVRFRIDGENRPVSLTLDRKSGTRVLDLAAMRAISRLGPLPTTPTTFRRDQQFVANILFATDLEDYERELNVLRQEAKLARSKPVADRNAIAFVITATAGAAS